MRPITIWFGCRVAKDMQYHPEYIKLNGKKVNSRLVVPFMHTERGYPNRETGERGPDSIISNIFTAWGAQADSYAKILTPGIEFSCLTEMGQYTTDYRRGGEIMVDPQGAALKVNNETHTIMGGCMWLGRESKKFTQKVRPAGADGLISVEALLTAVAGGQVEQLIAHVKQGPALWEAKLNQVKTPYAPGMAQYGWAKVVAPPVTQTAYQPPVQNNAGAGLTYAMLLGGNWTPQQIYAHNNGEYRGLIPADVLATLIPPIQAPPVVVVPPAPSAGAHVM